MRAVHLSALMMVATGCCPIPALAHPMGNLSINRYARLEPGAKGVNVTYVLDLAEIPSFELMQNWGLPQGASQVDLAKKAAAQASEWLPNLVFTENGRQLKAVLTGTNLAVIDGAGNLPVLRITSRISVPAQGGKFNYEDRNYSSRAGWREIVVASASGAGLKDSSAGDQDLSQALTAYPQDPTKAPPQDMQASFTWTRPTVPVPPAISIAPAIAPVMDAAVHHEAGARPAEKQAMGTITRNDSISQLLRQKSLTWPLMGTLIGLAFWFGALHALEPGHGKTMVAAYLIGERGTAKHALLLGGMVTFAHTISVFLLGLVTMFLSQYIMPEKISKFLGIVSGLSIVWIGGMMLWRRALGAWKIRHRRPAQESHHDHGQGPHSHVHEHGGHTHSHAPAGEISMGGLIALGASGGLVPCPSALILLLSAISIGRIGLGLVLLVAFSLGLAIVLSCTGLMVLYARNLLPAHSRTENAAFRLLPVVSAAAILLIGVVMTSVSLGWIPATKLIS